METTNERAEAISAIEAHFARLHVGQTDVQLRCFSDDEVRAYASFHQVEYPGRYVNDQGHAMVLPAMFFLRPAVTFGLREGPQMARGGIFTQTHRRYWRPLRVDEPVTLTGEIVDKYERRGFFYIAVDWRATDDVGESLASGREWHTLGFVRRTAQRGLSECRSLEPPDFASAAHTSDAVIKKDSDSGRELHGRTLVARLPEDGPGVHNDTEARRAGLAGGAVINEFHFSHLAEMLMDEFGPGWLADGEIEMKYVAPLRGGGTLVPRGRVLGTATDGRAVLDLWCENGEGDHIAMGRASCIRSTH